MSLFQRSPLIPSWMVSLAGPEAVEESFLDANSVFTHFRDGVSVSDGEFDRIYPLNLRKFSKIHWTPVSIARRAASLLVPSPGTRVLDVGSGCGKFCLVGALTTEGIFTGVEQRDYLTKFSNNLVTRHQLPRVSFIHGNMMNLDWSSFDSFYLFNPFYENVASFYEADADSYRIDHSFRTGEEQHEMYVEAVEANLGAAKKGTRVVTFYGFGGEFPPSYRKVLSEPHGSDVLDLWLKERN